MKDAPLVPLVDLDAQRQRLGGAVERAVARVVQHAQFVLGPEVHALEDRLSDYCDVPHAVTCSSGTDALVLALRAVGVRRDDFVLVPSFTFVATAEAVVLAGAIPVFVDVRPDTFCIDARSVESALGMLGAEGATPRAVVSVDLFGQPCDYDALRPLCDRSSVALVVDACQAFGARWNGTPVSRIGDAVATSFFPSKPLGCYGDGGAVFAQEDAIAEEIRCLRVHGRGGDGGDGSVRIGINGRLDTLQAAVLLEKLRIFDEELAARRALADRYDELLRGLVTRPVLNPGSQSVWAHYTVVHPARDLLGARLRDRGVATGLYYPSPVHCQPAYRRYRRAPAGLPVTERLAEQVISLPLHPYLSEAAQDRVVDGIRTALAP